MTIHKSYEFKASSIKIKQNQRKATEIQFNNYSNPAKSIRIQINQNQTQNNKNKATSIKQAKNQLLRALPRRLMKMLVNSIVGVRRAQAWPLLLVAAGVSNGPSRYAHGTTTISETRVVGCGQLVSCKYEHLHGSNQLARCLCREGLPLLIRLLLQLGG